jgi:2'-5' RNA ligase
MNLSEFRKKIIPGENSIFKPVMNGYQVTLILTPPSMAFFEAQRKRYYPGHANRMPAHLTLIYHAAITAEQLIACTHIPSFKIQITGLVLFKNGVAYEAAGGELFRLHDCLAAQCGAALSFKDQQPFHPHITICNQVTPYKAKRVYEELCNGFAPFEATATGISLNNNKGEALPLLFDV